MTMIKDAEYHHPGLRGRLQHSAPGNARPEGEGQVGQLEQQERHDKVSIALQQSGYCKETKWDKLRQQEYWLKKKKVKNA